MIPASHRR